MPTVSAGSSVGVLERTRSTVPCADLSIEMLAAPRRGISVAGSRASVKQDGSIDSPRSIMTGMRTSRFSPSAERTRASPSAIAPESDANDASPAANRIASGRGPVRQECATSSPYRPFPGTLRVSRLLAGLVGIALGLPARGIDLVLLHECPFAFLVVLVDAPAVGVGLQGLARLGAALHVLLGAARRLLGLLGLLAVLDAGFLELFVALEEALRPGGGRGRRPGNLLALDVHRRLVGVDRLAVLVDVLVELGAGEGRK